MTKKKTLSGRFRAMIVWIVGLFASLAIGFGCDLFLSPEARHSALAFQRHAIEMVSAFAPQELIGVVGASASQTSWHSPGGAYTFFIPAFRFIGTLHENLIGQGMLGLPIVILLDLGSLAVICACVYLANLDLTERDRNGENIGRYVAGYASLPFQAGGLAYVLAIVSISLFMLLLKFMAMLGLYAFGWLTSLAGVAAIAGTVSASLYFIVLKALEKRLDELTESLIGRFMRSR